MLGYVWPAKAGHLVSNLTSCCLCPPKILLPSSSAMALHMPSLAIRTFSSRLHARLLALVTLALQSSWPSASSAVQKSQHCSKAILTHMERSVCSRVEFTFARVRPRPSNLCTFCHTVQLDCFAHSLPKVTPKDKKKKK